VKLNQPIVKLNEGGFFSSFKCDRKEKMNIISLALCVGYLPAIHKYKKEIDVFNHKEGDHWTIFHYAAANEEVAGLLILLEDEFLKTLCEDYRIILSREYDYLTSEAAIIETIEANEYEFKADGTRF
jgi:hypothetical protein